MTNTSASLPALLACGALLIATAPAYAQPLGSFSWQLQPFCNNVTVNITQQGNLFTVDGADDQCGSGQRAPLVGVATLNPDGSVGFGLHIVTVPGGRPVGVDARVSLATLSGPWSDSAGNSGTFAFNARTGGLARPLPTIPGSALAPGSVTAAQLGVGAVGTANIADGSITPQKLSAGARLRWSGLTTSSQVPEGVNTVVRTVTMAIPAAGQVMVNASGLFDLATGAPAQFTWCSISTGTAVETAHYLYVRTNGLFDTALSNVPFAGTRVYAVTPGTFTVNLVCTSNAGIPFYTPSIQTAQLTALFVPN